MRKLLLSILIIMSFLCGISSQTRQAEEYQLKAVFIERFTRFIAFEDSSILTPDYITICVLGRNPFKDNLENVFENRNLYNRNVKIQYLNSYREIEKCNIVFLTDTYTNDPSEAIKWSERNKVLTISERNSFASFGVVINFRIENNKIRYEINPEAARRCGIRIERVLLNSAIIVEDGE